VTLLENFPERTGNGRVVLFAADFLFGRTVESSKMVGGDTTLLRVKFCKLNRIGVSLVVENDRGLRLRVAPPPER
jgi:hypothetical protein